MAVDEKHVLDLTSSGIKKLEKRDGVGIRHLILDDNELAKLESLECFSDVEKLSACRNSLVRMFAVSKLHHLSHLNLSENNIICIEGIKELNSLTTLNLCSNSIKSIQNLQHSDNLTHLDLSKNNITFLVDISYLTKLKVLHLNGNKISSLNHSSSYLPSSLCLLSLADNAISDLNEVSYLFGLHCLEQLTISGNPCVLATNQTSIFDYRPFVVNWCLGLRLLDGFVVTQKESLKAEWLYSQGKGRHFKPGEHGELLEYLAQTCPLTSEQLIGEEDEKFSKILQMQRQHKEQFLHELSQGFQCKSSPIPEVSNMTHSYHAKTDSAIFNGITESCSNLQNKASRIMYESAPEVLFHQNPREPTLKASPSLQPDKCSHSLKTESLHQSAKSPITIEQVVVDLEVTKNKAKSNPKTPYQHYEDRIVRPAPIRDVSVHSRSDHAAHSKGTPVRKVSKRATSPCTLSPSPGRSRIAHSPSLRSKLSPSRSCMLQEKCSTKFSASKNSSESDTSEEHSQNSRIPYQNLQSALSHSSVSRNSSPISRQKVFKESNLTKQPLCFNNNEKGDAIICTAEVVIESVDRSETEYEMQKLKDLSEKFHNSIEDLNKYATKIQSAWRGHYVRHHNYRVFRLRQEIRFRRMEDHIQNLHLHLCRLTDFVLRQQQDLQHERELRKVHADDIRNLYEKAKELQKDISIIFVKRSTDQKSKFHRLSEHNLFEAAKYLNEGKDVMKGNAVSLPARCEKTLQDASPCFLSSALQYSTQAFQENSGLFSPSSQTSSIISPGADMPFTRLTSGQEIPPSASDTSEADSGLHSMVSPNLTAFLENEKSLLFQENDDNIYHSCSRLGPAVYSFPPFKGLEEKGSAFRGYNTEPQVNPVPSPIKGTYSKLSREKGSALLPDVGANSEFPLECRINTYKNKINSSCQSYPTNTSVLQGTDASEGIVDNICGYETQRNYQRASNQYISGATNAQINGFYRLQEKTDAIYPNSGSSNIRALTACESIMPSVEQYVSSSSDSQKESPLGPVKYYIPKCNNIDCQCEVVNFSGLLDSGKNKYADLSHGCTMHKKTASISRIPCECKNEQLASEECLISQTPYNRNSCKALCDSSHCFSSDMYENFTSSRMHSQQSPKNFRAISKSKPSTPLEEVNAVDSPQSPCTVEMSGRISHSCSFQSDGFTTAEELSATATVKLFSSRALSMTCLNGSLSPQGSTQRTILTNDNANQSNLRSPLVLAASVWENKVQDIESTFHQLQSQIRDLEGAFGQIGQFGQFFYPGILQEDPKEPRHVAHQREVQHEALVLDMPKINFKRTDNASNDVLFQTHFAGPLGTNVPFLPPPPPLTSEGISEKQENCHIEELESEIQCSDNSQNLKFSLKMASNPRN